MKRLVLLALTCATLSVASSAAFGQCSRFPASASSAFDEKAGKITLPWRTDRTNPFGLFIAA